MKKKIYNRDSRSESGQVLIILTIGIISLLGFAGLAIDGGRVYAEKRNIQGVADTTSMTGALYIAQNLDTVDSTILTVAQNTAEQRAASSGYDSTKTTVTITEDSTYYYVETVIRTTVEPTIGKVIFNDDFGVAARSMARVQKVSVFAFGQAFFALNKTACKAIKWQGNADMQLVGSGIFSNSSCTPNSINIQGSPSGDISGDITSVGGIFIQKPGNITANKVVGGAGQYDASPLTEPNCSGLPNRTDSGSTLYPGIYSGGISPKGNVTMEPGLYCLDGNFKVSGKPVITGENVTIFLRGSASFQVNGGDLYLTAPQGDVWADGSGKYWNGMLVFQQYGNASTFISNGNAGSYFEGTIFVPDAECRINGSGSTTALDVQVVCNTILLLGTADLYLNYNSSTKYIPPITIDLVK